MSLRANPDNGQEANVARESGNEVVAALRDASFLMSGRFNTSRTIHYVPVYHVVRPENPHYSGCGVLIASETEVRAEGVFHRCQRRGCKERWPS